MSQAFVVHIMPYAGRYPCLHLFANCTLLLKIKLFNTKEILSDPAKEILILAWFDFFLLIPLLGYLGDKRAWEWSDLRFLFKQNI